MVASISSEILTKALGRRNPPVVIDVRKEQAYLKAPLVLPGSLRRRPEEVANWIAALDRNRKTVVYCVHGHEVSQGVTARLVEAGIDVAYLEGGIEGWTAAGLRLCGKDIHAAETGR